MSDEYISREAVVEALNSEGYTKNMRVHKKVLSIPAADVVKRKKSKWEWNSSYGYYFCPECHSISPREDQDGNGIDCPNFCHDCGADMRGEP